jgi:hypothetical protein
MKKKVSGPENRYVDNKWKYKPSPLKRKVINAKPSTNLEP